MPIVPRRLLLALASIGLFACNGEVGDCGTAACLFKNDPQVVSLEARLATSEVEAGTVVPVRCFAKLDDASTRELDEDEAALTVSPASDAIVVGLGLTANKAGRYEVSCSDGADHVSPPVVLTVHAGAPARTVATLSPASIRSGEQSQASCRIEDQLGNPIEGGEFRLAVSPIDGVTVSDLVIHGARAGDYRVGCIASRMSLPATPATLSITAGTPTRLEVQLSAPSVLAGEQVFVTCIAADPAGNVVDADTHYTVTPLPTTVDELGFVANTAGSYEVVCELPSASLVSGPARVTVGAGPPATLEIVAVDPALPVYPKNAIVELTVRMSDLFGNEAMSASWGIEANPPGSTQFSGGHRVQLAMGGTIELVASVTSPTANGMPVSDSITIQCDAGLPEVVFDFPARAEIVQGTPGQSITLSGRATDPSSRVASFTIEGQTITLGPNGEFSANFLPRWGVNVFEGSAIDEAGNARDFAQSFELASTYRRAAPNRTVSGRIDDGLMVRLSQAAIDDNSADVDDLATIIKLAVQQMDIRSLIPNPVTSFHSDCSVLFVTITGDLRLHVDSVNFGTPILDITSINGGLHLRAEIPNLAVQLHTTGDVCEIGVGISGTATVQRAIIEGDLTVTTSNGGISVSMATPSVQLVGFGINLNLPSIIDWAVDGILNLFEGAIANELEDALAAVIRDEVPGVVDDFLSSVAFGTSINLPAPISLALGIGTRLGSLAFTSSGGSLGFDTTVYAAGAIFPEPLGGILQESRSTAALTNRGALVIGLAYDLINQALYSIWYGGGLALDLAQFIPGQLNSGGQMLTVTANAEALLPPVLSPSGDPAFPLELAIGDLRVDASIDGIQGLPPIAATIYASIIAKASVSVSGAGVISFALAPSPRVSLDFTTPLADVLDLTAFVAQLEGTFAQLLPVLFNQAIQGVPIPTLDLSSLAGNVLPAGIRLGLGSPSAEVQSSYLVLGGALVPVP